jgi:hypothetical protein
MPRSQCTLYTARPAVPVLLLLLVVVAAGAPAGTVAAQEVTLGWRFQPGDVHRYLQTQTTRMESPMGEITSTQTTRIRQEVVRVGRDGAADLRVTQEALRVVQDGPMGRQEFDSETDAEPDDPGMRFLSMLTGHSFEMTLAPDGEVRRVAGMEDLVDAIIAPILEQSPDRAEQFRDMLENMFDEERWRALMQQGIQTVPTGAVGPGAEWAWEFELDLAFGTSRANYAYRFQEVAVRDGRRVARINMSGTIGDIEIDADNPMAALMEVSAGDVTGTLEFDVDRGVLLRASSTSTMTMSSMGTSMSVETTLATELLED